MDAEPRAADIIWLKEIERRLEHGLPLDVREMMVALRDQLPRGFKPSDVDRRLLHGAGPSLEGLRLIGDRAHLLPDVEKTIRHIKARLIEYPSLGQVTAAEISQALDLPVRRVESVLALLSSAPGAFLSGASGGGGGYTAISLGRDDIVSEYLAFESLDRLLDQRPQTMDVVVITGRTSPVVTTVRSPPKETPSPGISETAFILMNMDPDDAALTDVCNAIKNECAAYGVRAFRIDDVEHQDRITDRILSFIKETDLIIADLSGERPNVYYEVGYAHAIGKRPILYRRKGTRLHFDLSVHNVPEYKNVSELSSLLHKRLEAILGRSTSKSRPADN